MPVDVGLDRQLVGAYGHDDRSNGFALLRAIVEVGTPPKTAVAYGVNNEEVGSWTTGVNSEWFRTLLAEDHRGAGAGLQRPDASPRAPGVAGAGVRLHDGPRSRLSAAVPAAGSARLGWGLVFKEYGSGREADAEYFAAGAADCSTTRACAGRRTRTAPVYGGGTIAQWFANADMDAIDVGIGILSMHSPMDVSAKVDLWELYRGFKAFLRLCTPVERNAIS